jgi:hypothetical protein
LERPNPVGPVIVDAVSSRAGGHGQVSLARDNGQADQRDASPAESAKRALAEVIHGRSPRSGYSPEGRLIVENDEPLLGHALAVAARRRAVETPLVQNVLVIVAIVQCVNVPACALNRDHMAADVYVTLSAARQYL